MFIRGKVAEITDQAASAAEQGKLVAIAEDTLSGTRLRIPVDMVVLCAAMESRSDAAGCDAAQGEAVRLELKGAAFELPVKIVPSLPQGLAGLPAGLPGMERIELPEWCAVKTAPVSPARPAEAGGGKPPEEKSG